MCHFCLLVKLVSFFKETCIFHFRFSFLKEGTYVAFAFVKSTCVLARPRPPFAHGLFWRPALCGVHQHWAAGGPADPDSPERGRQPSVPCLVSSPRCPSALCRDDGDAAPSPGRSPCSGTNTDLGQAGEGCGTLCWRGGPGEVACRRGRDRLPAAGVRPLTRGQLTQAHTAAGRTGSPSACHREGRFFSLGHM